MSQVALSTPADKIEHQTALSRCAGTETTHAAAEARAVRRQQRRRHQLETRSHHGNTMLAARRWRSYWRPRTNAATNAAISISLCATQQINKLHQAHASYPLPRSTTVQPATRPTVLIQSKNTNRARRCTSAHVTGRRIAMASVPTTRPCLA